MEWGTHAVRVNDLSLAACTIKVKPTTPLKKVFEAAEVRALDPRCNSHYVWINPIDVTL